MKVLILGASYGSLLSTKLLMAGHDVTLVCMPAEAELIKASGTTVRLKLRDESEPRLIWSGDCAGTLDAVVPGDANPADFDIVALAMQEPQFGAPEIRDILGRIGEAGKPVVSIMNMPPLSYLLRIPGVTKADVADSFTDASVWDALRPEQITLCSPDPQAFRPPEEDLNFLHVGLPTNFKAAAFDNPEHTDILRKLESDIAAVRLDDKDVPVKLRTHDSIYVPLAKWPMLLTGNYRAVTRNGAQSIRDAVHGDLEKSRKIYQGVEEIIVAMGGSKDDLVPFEKYAAAAENLLKPSSGARALEAGAKNIERVDKLVQGLARARGIDLPEINETVETVDFRLQENRKAAG